MKGVFVILDGVSDRPCRALAQKTPLEAAKTPNLDIVAQQSKIDYCYTVQEGLAPQSHNAVISLLGYDSNSIPRGPLEAIGAGIQIKNGDLVLRTNFATLESLQSLEILDKRAGRTLTTKEALALAKTINEKIKLPFKFEFYPTIQHRGVLIIRGGFSENITNADPFYGLGVAITNPSYKLKFSSPMDEEDDSKLSSDLVNSFIRQSFQVLEKHPINLTRAKNGLFAANIILCREAGNSPAKLKKLKGKWIALGYMPLEGGIAKATGMEVYKFRYPKLKNIDVYSNLFSGLKKAIKNAIKMLKRNYKKYDYFYIHFKETDIPGHDNLPHEKVKMIELLDARFFSFLKEFIKNNKLIITADHTTACRLKSHTADPVPVLTYPSQNKHKEQRFTETCALNGRKILPRKLLENYFFAK